MADVKLQAVISAKDEASKTIQSVGSGLVSLTKIVGAAALAVGGLAIAFGVSAVKSFQDSEKEIAQTNAVLKSTGGVAGITADKVTELASSLQNVTTFSDETIRSGENLLLTFTNIGKDTFPEATKVMLDMSQALGQDLKGSAIQLGKALQDPILGVSALRRVGVNFSEDQQKVIKKLVETGHTLDAQKLILKELNTEFGGSASAAALTYSGRIEVLKNKFDDFKESVGKVIVDAISPFLLNLERVIEKAGGAEGIMATLTGKVNDAKKSFNDFIEKLKPLQPLLDYLKFQFSQLSIEVNKNNLLMNSLQATGKVFMGVLVVLAITLGVVANAILIVVRAITFLASGVNTAIMTVKGTIERAIGYFYSLKAAGYGTFSAIFMAANQFIAQALPRVVLGAINSIARMFSIPLRLNIDANVFNLKSKVNGLIGRINGSLGSLGVHIPFLAKGGIVTRPTLAMIGEAGPEAVVPLNRMGGMGGQKIEVTLNNYGSIRNDNDLQSIVRAVEDTLTKKLNLNRMGA